MQSGRKGAVTADTYTNYCYDVIRYLKVNLQLRFQVWATQEEIQIFQRIKDHIRSWNANFVTATDNRDLSNIPSFDKLINDLSIEILQLSTILRKEIEKIPNA
jgi:hypothetical protein